MKFWFGLVGLASTISLSGLVFLVIMKTPAPKTTPASHTPAVQIKNINVEVSQPATTPGPVIITAVGDVMLDRYVHETIKKHGPLFPFEKIQPELMGDVVLGNLEGPFTEQASVATNEKLIFTFDPALAPILKQVGFTNLALANNHTLNFGASGLATTREVATAAGLKTFGDPSNRSGFGISQSIHGRGFAFIGYHGLASGRETVLNDIRTAQAVGSFVIVMAHWGVEYQLTPTVKQIADAHALIEAGADLVLGAHPHVIQPFEVYQGKFIAYSLGNFLFDQYFSAETLQGLLLRFSFADEAIGVDFLPLVTKNGQVVRLNGPARDTLLERLVTHSTIDEEQRPGLRRGHLTLPYVQTAN